MFNCMVVECTHMFEAAELYLDHLKEFHRVPSIYRYSCTKPGCGQIFTKYHPFRKHIIGQSVHRSEQHEGSNTNNNNNIINGQLETVSEESIHSNTKRNKLDEASTSYDLRQERNEKYDKVKQATIMFTLSLHNKNNITRKDVYNIQNEASAILSELAKLLEDFNMR